MTDFQDLYKIPCPCGSGFSYEKCCHPFHAGKLPKTIIELMRSRFSAYVLNLPAYLIHTTHPASPHFNPNKFSWKRQLADISKNSTFQNLQILGFKELENIGTVTFSFDLIQDKEKSSLMERSYFEKFNNRWTYRTGEVIATKEKASSKFIDSKDILNILPLTYYNDPFLRKKIDPVTEMTLDIQKLIDQMISTMDSADGIGLAAPQVHQNFRLFVIREPINEDTDDFRLGDAKVFINPSLYEPSKTMITASEGCLSIPTIRAKVERPKEITIEYESIDGKKIRERHKGLSARVIMHENDHLNGVLFIDRIDQKDKERLKKELEKLHERIHRPT